MTDDSRFENIEAFVAGAIGEPGDRTFYLQARVSTTLFSVRCEKQQVGQLGRYLVQIASALGASDPDRDVVGLIEPIDVEWAVGEISVAVDEATNLIVVRAEQMPEPVETYEGETLTVEELQEAIDAQDLEVAEFTLTPGQALGFGEKAEELMASGRPPCQLCGAPMDPEGHNCPRWN